MTECTLDPMPALCANVAELTANNNRPFVTCRGCPYSRRHRPKTPPNEDVLDLVLERRKRDKRKWERRCGR